MKKFLVLCLSCLLSLTFLAGCAGSKDDQPSAPSVVEKIGDYQLANPGYLTVAVSTDFAPMEFLDLTKEGQEMYAGADIEFAKYVAAKLGVTAMFKSMDFDITLTALDSHTADIAISGFSYTADRAASYLYTDCYYAEGDDGQVVVVSADKKDVYTSLASLNVEGLKIAAQNGALQQDLVKEQLANATMVAIDDLNSAYDSLTTGAVDGVAVAGNVAATLVNAYPDKYVVCPEPFQWEVSGDYALVKAGNTALADAVNKCIEEMEDDQFEKWMSAADALFAQLGDKASESIISEEE